MNAEILAVGTELLMGQIANTNAQYLSRRFAELGIDVYYHSVVGDNPRRLKDALIRALERSDIVITTGGLGPTKDDLTKETIAEALGLPLVVHQESLDYIKAFFSKLNRPMCENNVKQAYLPAGSKVVPNRNGTAPGCIVEQGGKVVIMLPGPPKEMIPMFDETVFPYFEGKTGHIIGSRLVKVFGMGESEVETRLMDLVEQQSNPTIAPYVGYGDISLRVTAKCRNRDEAEALIAPVVEKIRERLGACVYSDSGESMEEVVLKLLSEKGWTLSTAESCTGGMLASRLINIPGASRVFDRGFVTYSNAAKVQELGVSQKTLEAFGAVSRETAEEMATRLVERTKTNAGLAVTGIAGPDGGTPEKPVGLVYVAACLNGRTESLKLNLRGDRERIRTVSCLHALDLLRRMLLGIQ
ncbi:competence/damage-inducible protein A [Thermoclostridium caenicola]|uniref:Putative competence-damage inducible protein n=1 Tax=Thermoclostridium caenicola TaxID=659425 RepID=A0A1M6FUQ1_9FIRM|nr:competence/damage-inducible protein A [Thermoclostridium caenicola]SHJ01417.1 competence/damage-inducible protein cinA [Thermoclostridium caenicola]HOP72921.1 competence/damage-inducible protein A [Thermoclostridium caenicola]